jgi:uncharacterized Tic20 family protein
MPLHNPHFLHFCVYKEGKTLAARGLEEHNMQISLIFARIVSFMLLEWLYLGRNANLCVL